MQGDVKKTSEKDGTVYYLFLFAGGFLLLLRQHKGALAGTRHRRYRFDEVSHRHAADQRLGQTHTELFVVAARACLWGGGRSKRAHLRHSPHLRRGVDQLREA